MDEYDASVMNNIVDETLGDADPSDYVRFGMKSSGFDRPLNTPYQRWSQVNERLSGLAGKLLQSCETHALDNNILVHVQHVGYQLSTLKSGCEYVNYYFIETLCLYVWHCL